MNANNDHKAYDWRSFVETKNYVLSPMDESIINIQWENMRDQAPSKASIKLILEKSEQGIKADWNINNYDLSFQAQGEASDLRLLLLDLGKELSSQLTEWKKSRFSTEAALL